jgi:hypothetical protein
MRAQIKGPVSTRVPIEIAESDRQWFSTERAAAYLDMSVKALLKHVERGNIAPEAFGQRGRARSHRFSRGTLDAFMRRGNAA